MASKNVMASSCAFVWYLVVRRINPRLFPLDVANVSFVLRCGALVSPPDSGFAAQTVALPPDSKKPGARPGFSRKQVVGGG
jgi:hypothetical protein